MPKRLSKHHCAGSKGFANLPDLPFFQWPTIFSLIFTHTANLSIRLSGSIYTSNRSPCFGVHISLYTWCPLIKVSRSKVVIKAIGSWSCKRIISVVILKANIPLHNVQACNDGFFLSCKIMQWNGIIAFSKHYSNVLIRMFLWMKVFICRKLSSNTVYQRPLYLLG